MATSNRTVQSVASAVHRNELAIRYDQEDMSTVKKKPVRKPRTGGVIYIRGAADLAKQLDEWKDHLNTRGGGLWTRERLAFVILQKAVKERAPDGEP